MQPDKLKLSRHQAPGHPERKCRLQFWRHHPYGNPISSWIRKPGASWRGNIREALVSVDPADQATFDKNLSAFEKELNEAEKRWAAAMAPFKGRRLSPIMSPGITLRKRTVS